MEKFLTYIIVLLTMGCVFFVFLTREQSIEGGQTNIPVSNFEAVKKQNHTNQSVITEDLKKNIPLKNMQNRVILKSFGMMITPQNSPISPERFQGFHTGVDLEIFSDEKDGDVPVYAICDGVILAKEYVDGYGGVFVQECFLNERVIKVIYGHVFLESVQANIGAQIIRGEQIGILGEGYSKETDFERKHLHLAFHVKTQRDMRGYVQNQNELSQWINPCEEILCASQIIR